MSGVGQWACVQEQTLGTVVYTYMRVGVARTDTGGDVFTVAFTGPAGTSRKDDGVEVAKAVLAAIGG